MLLSIQEVVLIDLVINTGCEYEHVVFAEVDHHYSGIATGFIYRLLCGCGLRIGGAVAHPHIPRLNSFVEGRCGEYIRGEVAETRNVDKVSVDVLELLHHLSGR